ncbi:MAG: hypothetical protein II045_04250 [Oscillospiraceae bacterium]|jgi:hypothetical protein|nr:hypothetical protein [Oscillospiraceae bacterium]MBQ1742288.1 hypothetical protein [Oscillospiraceae bacterium]MBQ2607231.1 hypothetical protein [Oscillospiraceae bacterium]MBQ5535999.1 hypothetical protein [Oscillospiraceae bacterium]
MARQTNRKVNYGGRVVGNLAYDLNYEERRRRGYEQPRHTEPERAVSAPVPKANPATSPRTRRRHAISVSPVAVLGFAALAVMVVMLVMSYAKLTEISSNVVSMKNELSSLEVEHVALVTRYEKTFDLSAIKEAAEAAGMSKPSAAQVYYVDLSAPSNVVIYQPAQASVLSRIFTALGQNVSSMVEYFK